MPRRKIYDFCIKSSEDRINILDAEWKASDVTSKWYTIGVQPDDDDSDQEEEAVGMPTKLILSTYYF